MLDRSRIQGVFLAGIALSVLARLPIPESAWAESPLDFRAFPMPNGLPVERVSDLVEDREGAIWVATRGEGLHRIHGAEWKTFTERDGLPGNRIRVLDASAGGGVWAGTGQGLALIRDDQVSTLTPEKLPILSGGDVSCVREMNSGQIVVGIVDGTVLLREAVGTLPVDLLDGWRSIDIPRESVDLELTNAIETAPREYLLARTRGGLGWLRDGIWTPDPTLANPHDYVLHEEFREGAQEIWAVERDGDQIYRLNQGRWTTSETCPPGVNDLARTDSGQRFVATHTGLFLRDTTGWQPCPLDPALGSPELSNVIAARDGSVWAGGLEGLIRGAPHTWLKSSQPDGPTVLLSRAHPNDPVRAMNFNGVVFAPEGSAWRPLFKLDPWVEKAWTLGDSTWMGDGRLWIEPGGEIRWIMVANGTLQTIARDELSIYAIDDGRRTELRTLPPASPTTGRYYVTAGGSLLYLADDGVYRLEEGAWTPFPTTPGYQQKHAFSLVETEPGVFWAGVPGGVERWIGNAITFFGETEGLQPNSDINVIHRARSGKLWFGSMGAGAYRYDGHAFERYTRDDGLCSNALRALLESSDGTIWMAAQGSGVAALRGGCWRHYDLEHGLPHEAALSFAETEEGVLWIGSRNQGLFRFRPDLEPPDTEILAGTPQIDSHGTGVFSFAGRDAWNQTPVRELHYAWRVIPTTQGADTPWAPFSTQTTVVTHGLERGHYRLEVRDSDENGNVDPTPATMDVTVLPPLWMRPAFFLPLSLSIVLAVVALLSQWFSRKTLLESEAALRTEVEIRKRAEALLIPRGEKR